MSPWGGQARAILSVQHGAEIEQEFGFAGRLASFEFMCAWKDQKGLE